MLRTDKLSSLLAEDGHRWMDVDEQKDLLCEGLAPYHARPVWLVCSMILVHHGYYYDNGLGVSIHMDHLRRAFHV